VWVLVNKMDLMDKEDPKRKRYEERRTELVAVDERLSLGKERKGGLRCFPTSIWDESLYKVGLAKMISLIVGMVIGHSHSDSQYQSHHYPSHLSPGPLSRRGSGRFRSRDIPCHSQIRLPARLACNGAGRAGISRRGEVTGSAEIREDLGDYQGVPQDLPVRAFDSHQSC